MSMLNNVSSMLHNADAEALAEDMLDTMEDITMEQDSNIDFLVDGVHDEDDSEISDVDVDDDDTFDVSDNKSSANPDFNYASDLDFSESDPENTYGKKPGTNGNAASIGTGSSKLKSGGPSNKPGVNGSASPSTAVSKDLSFEENDIENTYGRQPGQDSVMESLLSDIDALIADIDEGTIEKSRKSKPGTNGSANPDKNFSAEWPFDENGIEVTKGKKPGSQNSSASPATAATKELPFTENEVENTYGKKPGVNGSAYVSMESTLAEITELTAAIEAMTVALEEDGDLDASDAIAASSGAGNLDTSTSKDEDIVFDDDSDDEDDEEDDLDFDDDDLTDLVLDNDDDTDIDEE